MAVVFEELKEGIVVVLYDFMLTSNHDTFWFDIAAIQEGLDPEASGAFIFRALRSLASESLIELGSTDGVEIYALTDRGIVHVEKLLETRGHRVRTYTPAPSADQIISRLNNPDSYTAINEGLKALANEISGSNSASEILGDDRDLVVGELECARQLSQNDKFRLGRLIALIVPTLRYVADKFAGQSIGEAAKQLVHFLLNIS